jgi:thiamine biosynthesis lipoprotein
MRSWRWPAWGTTVTLIVADGAALGAARRLLIRTLAQTEHCADLGNPRSEVSRLSGAAGRKRRISPLLSAFLEVNLTYARATNGLFDPTVAAATIRATRNRGLPGKDLSPIPACGGLRDRSRAPSPVPGWRSIESDGRTVRMPAGTILDLTALGKASTARYCADLVWNRLGVGVLVDLGGDCATAGPAPVRGWPTLTDHRPGEPTRHRPDWSGSASLSTPVIDPGTGQQAPRTWKTIEVLPDSPTSGLVEAKALAVAAAVLGPQAPEWLATMDAVARLESWDGTILRIGGSHDPVHLREQEITAS